MSNQGFVYVLSNESMPDLIKIGCTERAPQARADQLSRHTGVPTPFRVLCYAEFDNFQAAERQMHERCRVHRVNGGREFFSDCLSLAVQLLWWSPSRLSFTDATLGTSIACYSELVMMISVGMPGIDYFSDLPNPYRTPEAIGQLIGGVA